MNMQATEDLKKWEERIHVLRSELQSVSAKYGSRNCMLAGCSFNCLTSHYVGKKAEKLKQRAKEMESINNIKITMEAPAPAAQLMPSASFGEGGRTAINMHMTKAFDFLRSDMQGKLGIHGMGGVGKTTLLTEINNELEKDRSHRFDHVIFLTASQECTVENIQKQIVGKLKLSKDDEDYSNKICSFLRDKSFVILLDDLWKPLDLKQVGIPTPFGVADGHKHKLIIATRFRQVCNKMWIHLHMRVDCLSKEDARLLFREKAGLNANNSDLRILEFADEVADECDGLPLALVTLAGILPQGQNVQAWKGFVDRLCKSKSLPLTVTDNNFLLILKTSYDFLPDTQKQQCFLHCALWPEGFNIPVDDLIECWLGHNLLGDNIESAYAEGHIIIDFLHQANLVQLVEPDYSSHQFDGCVKLHDMMREMALWIACDCGVNNNKWIVRGGGGSEQDASHEAQLWSKAQKILVYGEMDELPSKIDKNDNLVTLRINSDVISSLDGIQVVNNFCSLQYLDLSFCYKLDRIPNEICQFDMLEFLNLSYTGVRILPEGLKGLTKLKFLLLRNTPICELPNGLLSALENLLELDVYNDNYDIDHPCQILSESDCLSRHLRALGIFVNQSGVWEKLVQLSHIHIWYLRIQSVDWYSTTCKLLSPDCLGKRHMRSNLKELLIDSCQFQMMEIDGQYDFPCLDQLDLNMLSKVKKIIWKGVSPARVFRMLRVLRICDCPLLEHVSWTACLPSLEYLSIHGCRNMAQLVLKEEMSDIQSAFQELRSLHLSSLGKLRGICDCEIMFPSLEELFVSRCLLFCKLPFATQASCPNLKKISNPDSLLTREEDLEKINFFRPLFQNYY